MIRPAVVLVAVALWLLTVGGQPASGQPAGGAEPVGWWALGDSYASGEGIPGTEPPHRGDRDCARATGRGTDAKAWAVVAGQNTTPPLDVVLAACTGAVSADLRDQAEQAARTAASARIVTLSIGGNDIGFADVIKACVDVPTNWRDAFGIAPGCNDSEAELRSRVDHLASRVLPGAYDDVAESVGTGGHIIVAGYPQILEDSRWWSEWQRDVLGACQEVLVEDADMLRSVAGYLNEQIALQVDAANRRWANRGVEFHWVDVASWIYETGDGPDQRHGLCSADPWINGITTGLRSGDLRFVRSFHPHQAGHTATGEWLAGWLGERPHITRPSSSGPDGVSPDRPRLHADGFGSLALGMTPDEAIATGMVVWRGWIATEASDGYQCATAGDPINGNLWWALFDEHGIRRISLQGDGYATDVGPTIGSTAAEVRGALGEPSLTYPNPYIPNEVWVYGGATEDGRSFEIDESGRVVAVSVGYVPALQLVEGCA